MRVEDLFFDGQIILRHNNYPWECSISYTPEAVCPLVWV